LIKTVITVLITLAILNAAVRMGGAAVSYYQLKDEAQRLIVFGARSTTQQLHERILQHAEELEIPLASEDLFVTREGDQTFVDAYYTQPVEILPNVRVPVELSFSVDSFAVASANQRP
jgi:hypothetical protein